MQDRSSRGKSKRPTSILTNFDDIADQVPVSPNTPSRLSGIHIQFDNRETTSNLTTPSSLAGLYAAFDRFSERVGSTAGSAPGSPLRLGVAARPTPEHCQERPDVPGTPRSQASTH